MVVPLWWSVALFLSYRLVSYRIPRYYHLLNFFCCTSVSVYFRISQYYSLCINIASCQCKNLFLCMEENGHCHMPSFFDLTLLYSLSFFMCLIQTSSEKSSIVSKLSYWLDSTEIMAYRIVWIALYISFKQLYCEEKKTNSEKVTI